MTLSRSLIKKIKENTFDALKKNAENDVLTYVPLQATYPEQRFSLLSKEKQERFDLFDQIEKTFIGNPHYSVLLLSGDSGVGKSYFTRYLIKKHWEAFDNDKGTAPSVFFYCVRLFKSIEPLSTNT